MESHDFTAHGCRPKNKMQRCRVILVALFSLLLIIGCSQDSKREMHTISPDAYCAFSEADAIVFVKGTPSASRTLYVFSRPDCVFCNRFENEFRKLNNIKVLSFTVVAGKDPSASLKKWCQYQESLGKTCDTKALERNNALAQQLGVKGTPTVIFPSRLMVPGFMGAGDVEKVLSGGRL